MGEAVDICRSDSGHSWRGHYRVMTGGGGRRRRIGQRVECGVRTRADAGRGQTVLKVYAVGMARATQAELFAVVLNSQGGYG